MTNSRAVKLHKKAEKAMQEAVNKVVKERKKSGVSLSVWKNGRVVKLSAKRLKVN